MLRVVGLDDYWTVVAQGLLLVVALVIDFISEERRRKALLAEKQ